MSKAKFKPLGWAVSLAVLALAGWYFYPQDGGNTAPAGRGPGGGGFTPPPVLVTVAEVERRLISDQIEAIGTLIANESVTITAQVTERVSRIHFNDGDYVEAGHILVELTSTEESAQLTEARVNLQESERQLRRLETLGRNVASAQQIDDARAQFEANQARYDAVVARMDRRLIRAPFSGLLGFRRISLGSLVSPGTEITTLDDISVMKLDFTVPETYLSGISLGNEVVAISPAWPDSRFRGQVEAIGSRVDPVSRSVTARAVLANEERELRPGMLMTVQLTGRERLATLIPEASLLQTGLESFVYVVDENNRVARRDVSVLQRRAGQVVIGSGLEQGERVVVDGVSMVSPGRQVEILPPTRDKSARS